MGLVFKRDLAISELANRCQPMCNRIHTHTYTHTYTHAHTHAHTHANANTHTHTHTHTFTHTHTHMHEHEHTHIEGILSQFFETCVRLENTDRVHKYAFLIHQQLPRCHVKFFHLDYFALRTKTLEREYI